MISIIICSINKTLAEQVQKNIAETIGTVWETIVIDNTQYPKGITQVYNIGASKAQHDILCFVHEDVIFSTQNWGKKLIEYFNTDSELGLIGIAGSKYKSNKPSGWYNNLKQADCCNIWHLDAQGKKQHLFLNPDTQSSYQEVVSLDGVFLCTRKKVWNETKFDEELLKGFHLYDIDFSVRVSKRHKNIVIYDINIVHLTEGGSFGNHWLEDTLRWHKKYRPQLPIFTNNLKPNIHFYNKVVIRTWLNRLKNEKIIFRKRIKWLISSRFWSYPSTWPYAILFLLKRLLKKNNI